MTTESNTNRLFLERLILWGLMAIWGVAVTFGINLMHNLSETANRAETLANDNRNKIIEQDGKQDKADALFERLESKVDQLLQKKFGYIPKIDES
jgi:hypothetical protein